MPTFDTPAPVRVVLDLVFGQARIVAGDRAETTVRVYPRDGDDRDDVRTAERLRVEYARGRLLVVAPEPAGSGGAVTVVIGVPTGSSLEGRGTAADFRAEGRLGTCRVRTGLGHIRLDRACCLELSSSLGDIRVDRAAGSVDATADSGDIDIGEVVRGTVVATTTVGGIRIGVAETSRAHLSLDSAVGTVYTSLSLLAAPAEADDVVHVQARTEVGDILVERSCPRG
ncbi:DUF4097 family beta strand repeat-containing protein [Yinghuangia seranimata]|uniref:DUF4097 family beta strand repeat-containing protein n=1 Tax=Yinghuangia seranimata TaxID=408067 RepID=UPI00248B5211|nr:DUF4097 family beta strand repeat-containing protein [Yinghuangia seranimata]MDI2127100.1 DUF4097 family beta strand repeat-containing protein [Yinghuangia seranimata]